MSKLFGIRCEGLEEQLESIISNHIKDKQEYIFFEIGVATAVTHRAIRDIISENIKTNNWLTIGLDILGSDDVNFNKISQIFTDKELIINKEQGETDVLGKLHSEEYHSVLVLRKDARDWIKNITDNSLDLVLIDAAHGYNDVTNDFLAIENKVKSDGLVLFHDYCVKSQGTDRQWDGDFINVRKACQDLGLNDNKRPNWEFVTELLGTRTTNNEEFGGNGMGIFKKI